MANWVTEPDAYLEPKLTPSGYGTYHDLLSQQ